MADDCEVVEDFYGVYLLFCVNPRYKGKTYIGFTVDPNRRIKQHNRGSQYGGARRTSNKGPWEMVLIIHGFPNEISALRFEWAWQHPHISRRLKGILSSKKHKEKMYDYCLRIVATMLQTKPWSRLPLTIRWLKQQYQADFPAGLDPPNHMPVAYGPVKPTQVTRCKGKEAKATKVTTEDDEIPVPCSLCDHVVLHKDKMRCLSKSCFLVAHITCLADKFVQAEPPGTLLPLEGPCPSCHTQLLWGDLVRLKRGCYQMGEEVDDDDNHWANALSQSHDEGS
ncbi:unnamed protein product [Meganyctiphanes norvegica]|uniref:Structure-specific endonuclease subunit SLX1 homolog n=1 Tax=Meganyctiphanes norvegica TaxID=48144 RepID=A0AAV2SF40_MEGNR